MKHVSLALCAASGVASAGGAGSATHAEYLEARQTTSLCAEMQQQMSPYFTDAEFVNAWLARTWENPRVYSPVNRPAMAKNAHSLPEGVPRCPKDTPRDVINARLKLQQIHGIDEKRQYYEADGSLTFRCARSFARTMLGFPSPAVTVRACMEVQLDRRTLLLQRYGLGK
jgi:hypothetical protein